MSWCHLANRINLSFHIRQVCEVEKGERLFSYLDQVKYAGAIWFCKHDVPGKKEKLRMLSYREAQNALETETVGSWNTVDSI